MPRRREAGAIAFLGMGLLNNGDPLLPDRLGPDAARQRAGSSILNATTPLFTVLAAHFLTR